MPEKGGVLIPSARSRSLVGGPKEIQPLHLSGDEKRQLREFLKTLTGDPVPAEYLRDLHNP